MEEGLKGLLIGASLLAFLTAMVIFGGILKNCLQVQELAGISRYEQKNIVLVTSDEKQ